MNIKIAAFTVTQKLNYTFFNDLCLQNYKTLPW